MKKEIAKKKIKNNIISIIFILAVHKEYKYLIEIMKKIVIFNDGEIYKIKINFLDEVENRLWSDLL